MPKIVTVDEMRAIEQASDDAGHSYAAMMALAGRAVAEQVKHHLLDIREPQIVILVGPGNNGGDGLVAGRLLAEEIAEAAVGAFMLKPRSDDDEEFAAATEAGVTIATLDDDSTGTLHEWLQHADVVVDAVFGTSLHLPVKGAAADLLATANEALATRRAIQPILPYTTPADPTVSAVHSPPVVVAVDCPSGLDCDTGAVDDNTIPADDTVTFAAAKPGLLTFPGASVTGRLHIGDIGLPALPELDEIPRVLADASITSRLLPERPRDSHKGTFGKAMIVAGSLNYTGAAYLAAAAAYRVGAGLVTGAAPQIIVPILAGMLPEATWLLLPHDMGVLNEGAVRVLRKEITDYDALLLGPGFGREDVTAEFIRELLQPQEEIRHSRAIGFVQDMPANQAPSNTPPDLPPLVIDADALNLMAGMDDWTTLIPRGAILTPHPGELARLTGLDAGEVQANRVALAQEKAAAWDCTLVLKGAFTVIAASDGLTTVLPFASSALASAGTGDVLAGAITGLLAQGLAPYHAAVAGGWLHGLAGIRATELLDTAASVVAGDVLELLPDAYAVAEATRG
jgi:ADP-dependent NAD(P)H-hydrate dehydratase / NAD(P)H-hydrate epimerase